MSCTLLSDIYVSTEQVTDQDNKGNNIDVSWKNNNDLNFSF